MCYGQARPIASYCFVGVRLMARFNQHQAEERNKQANAPAPKLPLRERTDQDIMRDMKRQMNVDRKFRKLLGGRQGQ